MNVNNVKDKKDGIKIGVLRNSEWPRSPAGEQQSCEPIRCIEWFGSLTHPSLAFLFPSESVFLCAEQDRWLRWG